MKLRNYPPGFAAHRYRLTPEEIEDLRRQNRIECEKQESYRKRLIEEGKLPPDAEKDETPA